MKVSDTNYELIVVAEDGKQYDISDFAEDLGWAENEKELATTITFTVGTDDETLHETIKIGRIVAVLSGGTERARAVINKAKVKVANNKTTVTVTAYDELYSLQTSEDQYYFSAGMTTKTIINQILSECGISI